MVFDKIANLDKYKNIIPHFESVKKILDDDFDSLELGHYLVEEGLSFVVSKYTTQTEKLFEVHHDDIDLQIIIDGEEYMEIGDFCNTIQSYNKNSDFALFDGISIAKIRATKNDFVIFYPFEFHKPGVSIEKDNTIKK